MGVTVVYLKDCLDDIISEYKKSFPQRFSGEDDEKFKWEAVKHFQDHWDIKAPNFKEMLEESLAKTHNLLTSGYFYAKAMLLQFAEIDPEAVRAAFANLYDESKDLEERIEAFWAFAEDWKANRNPDGWKNHYQNTNAISTYLWLRYPDKYYIYKYSECLEVAKVLNSAFVPKRNSSPANVIGAYKLYDEISHKAIDDVELVRMFQESKTEDCYPDPYFKTLAIDIGFFISRFYNEQGEDNTQWFPADYTPGITVQQWVDLLQDQEVFTASSLQIMKRMKDYGGAATCKQLSVKYGETFPVRPRSCWHRNTHMPHLRAHTVDTTGTPPPVHPHPAPHGFRSGHRGGA